MNVRFCDQKLDRLETDARYTMGLPPVVVKAFRRRMQQIRAALDERDFYSNKGMHYEKLRGNRQGQHSIRLNNQYRLIIAVEQADAASLVAIISIEDYH